MACMPPTHRSNRLFRSRVIRFICTAIGPKRAKAGTSSAPKPRQASVTVWMLDDLILKIHDVAQP